MPYYITNESPDCSGWATIKEDGEVIGCHENKQDAIDQMVAVSIAEDMEPGGERKNWAGKMKMKKRDEEGLKGINMDNDKKDRTSMTKVERRVKTDVDFELRIQDGQMDGMRFSGYAAVFNSDSEPLPFTERILPGAFKKTLRSRNEIKLFMNHNMDKVLGSTRSKTLKLKEDDRGLLAEAILPDTTDGRDLSVLMQRGDVHAMSFGFSVPDGGDRWMKNGAVRELTEIRLHEVSIVTGFPAYEATTASVRSLDILATRTNTDPDQLLDAITKLENGETLKTEQADLISEVVAKLKEEKPITETDLLDIKRKQLDLLYKAG